MSKRLGYLCVLVLFFCAGSVSAQLLAHYEFEQDTETQAYDSSGKGNHGQYVSSSSTEYEDPGDPNWVDGNITGSQALEFNGDLTVVLPAEDMGLRSDTGGVAFWLLMEEGDLQGGINTIWWGGDNTTGTGFGPENETHIHMETYSSSYWLGGELSFFGQNSPETFFVFSDPNKGDDPATAPSDPILMNDGQWHHVVCTWGNDDGNAKMYHNGVLLSEKTQGTLNYPFTVMVLGSMGSGNRPLTGILDDVQIYGRALSPEEVSDVMNAGLALTLPASLPSPANNITEVALNSQFTWTVGDTAASHNVYFGRVFDDVNDATVDDPHGVLVSSNQAEASYDPGMLEFLQTYYWRVDEVEDDGVTVHRGTVWSFTTRNFQVIEDFESYDNDTHLIFDSWIDGYFDEENGLITSYDAETVDAGGAYVETENIHGGLQAMPMFYDTDHKFCEAYLPLTEGLQDWTNEVEELSLWFKGYSALTGDYTEEPAGTFNITASGADIWGGYDEFTFVYKEVSGTMSLVARIDSLVNTDGFTKAGIMVRDTLEPGARNTAIFFTPENATRLQRRAAVDGDYISGSEETLYAGDPNDPNTFPRWLKIERNAGGLVRAYTSTNGNDWEMFSLARSMTTMSNPVYLGLAVTSHDDTLMTEAVISHVTLEAANGGDTDWLCSNVGILNNPPEPVFVRVNDQAVVYYDDPNATQINDWAQWNIPLQSIANQGVNLSQVTKLTLGVGQQGDRSTDGGEGTLFVDDIRLYRSSVPVAIDVENGSFELPGSDKKTDFNDVPGWSTDTAVVDSGIDVIDTATEGTWGVWLMSGDPSLWQMTDHVVAAGDAIELKVDARLSWLATTLRMTLYTLDDEDVRVPVISQDVTLSDVMQEFSVGFKANDLRDAIGSTLGIELSNVTDLGESTWLEIDNIRLTLLESH